MLTKVRDWWRRRQLSGDARAGEWARAEARRLQWSFIRRQRRVLAGAVVAVTIVTTVVLLFVHDAFQRGFIVGAAVAGTLLGLAILVMQATGTAPKSMGAAAEQWTASELRPLRRNGWRLVNHFSLRASSDIDHVLVGSGGVIAVETKWSARGWTVDPPEERVIQIVQRLQRDVKVLRLWQPLRAVGPEVDAVVFLWGGSAAHNPGEQGSLTRIDDVTIVVGSEAARQWRASCQPRSGRRLFGDEQVDQMWRVLEHHARRRDSHDRLSTPAPRSVLSLCVAAAVLITVGVGCFWLNLQLFVALNSVWLWGLANVPLLGIPILARRVAKVRLIATAAFTGLSAASVLGAAAAIYTAAAH
ncbi:nuclease-like protein [Kribbella antiqua]|uniref:Nuclease-like protein n=1 Tax=Kribbella antiqua TaxID=2512217 RepID=A0A4R2IAF7_9ACTN|nr:nuclease-related domain-containing protein [Kribbella antiqua]TCO41046.1 nuclease-like protein [Kribbella antiqua]